MRAYSKLFAPSVLKMLSLFKSLLKLALTFNVILDIVLVVIDVYNLVWFGFTAHRLLHG